MKDTGLVLVARYPSGDLWQHPVETSEDVVRVFGWLGPLTPSEAVYACEEVA